MSRVSRARTATRMFPETMNHHLNLYSVAAIAAGVSVLALAHPAEGEVVVTQANIPITGTAVTIDLNKDGIADFQFSHLVGGYDHSLFGTLLAAPLTGGEAVGQSRGSRGPYASALAGGANIGPSAHFSSSAARGQVVIERSIGSESASINRGFYGKWGDATSDTYLGVRFLIKGKTHYGWVRMTVTTNNQDGMTATITEYAYETVAGKKVGAGDTTDFANAVEVQPNSKTETKMKTSETSLGMLAWGASGLNLWRR